MPRPFFSINPSRLPGPRLSPELAGKSQIKKRQHTMIIMNDSRKPRAWALMSAGLLTLAISSTARAQTGSAPDSGPPLRMPQLTAAAQISRDAFGLAHIAAQNEHDLFFLRGRVHAQDRLFQMDVSRRLAAGTLAELLGSGALAQDVQLRTIRSRRAAERALPSQSPRVKAILAAYTPGVNAYL